MSTFMKKRASSRNSKTTGSVKTNHMSTEPAHKGYIEANNQTTPAGDISVPITDIGKNEKAARNVSRNFQTNLKVSQPNDKHEQEADRVSEQVMRMPDSRQSSSIGRDSLLTNSIRPGGDTIQQQTNAGVEKLSQTKKSSIMAPKVIPVTGAESISLKGSGQPLSESERNYFEPRFGVDFSNVRVHTDTTAASVAQEVSARAFTVGRDVVFGAEEYASGSADSKKLMAHELTHVVQQSDAAVTKPSGISSVKPNIQRVPRNIEFEDSEAEVVTVPVFSLGEAGRDPYDIIQDHVSQVSAALNNMRLGELGAINQFLTHMSFSSSSEAQPDVLGAVFKYVGKQLWESAVSSLPSVAGIPASQIIGVITAMTDELERAAAAQHSYDLANFMATLRSATLTVYNNQITTLETTARKDLDQQFSELEGIWDRDTGRAVGEKAQFLRDLDQLGNAILQSVPLPIEYEEALIVKWITDRRAGGQYTGGEGAGNIQLKYDVTENNGAFTYSFESAKLFTATKSGQAADMLTRVMNSQNKKVYELGVPVQVMLETEGMMPGGRSYYAFWIRSRTDFDRTGIGWEPAERAWSNMSWNPIDSVQRISGG